VAWRCRHEVDDDEEDAVVAPFACDLADAAHDDDDEEEDACPYTYDSYVEDIDGARVKPRT
jgi:hypothetical protein